MPMPAIALAAAAGRRAQALELAREIERRGFSGIYCGAPNDNMGLCLSIAHVTSTIPFGTAIVNVYTRHAFDLAQSAAYIHEVSGGRFLLGIGVSHEPANRRLGVSTGKPLSDMRDYVARLRSMAEQSGGLPPIVLATLRRKMTRMAGEIAEGAVWANASLSHLPASLAEVPPEKRSDPSFFVGNMLPVCIDDDPAAAAARNRRAMLGYVMLPNYRNYWKEAGYVEEMEAVERALAAGDREQLAGLMSDRWLADCTLGGTVRDVRAKLEEWFAAGMRTPILVPSSTSGGQMKAFEEIFAAFA